MFVTLRDGDDEEEDGLAMPRRDCCGAEAEEGERRGKVSVRRAARQRQGQRQRAAAVLYSVGWCRDGGGAAAPREMGKTKEDLRPNSLGPVGLDSSSTKPF